MGSIDNSIVTGFVSHLYLAALCVSRCVQDPWEMDNIYATADASLKTKLHDELEKLYRCKGTPDGDGKGTCD